MQLLFTKLGTINAMRKSGGLYCKGEVRATKIQEGDWEEVNCKSCIALRHGAFPVRKAVIDGPEV